MDLDKIRQLLEIVAESGIAEVEIEEDDFKVTVRRNGPTVTMQQSPGPYGYPPMPGYMPAQPYPQGAGPQAGSGGTGQAPPTPSPKEPPTAEATEAEAEEKAGAGVTVTAPIVGTFYRAPAPDADPFVEEGQDVKPGDVLCIIEAMKLMNEIECEHTGTITEILVEDAQPVEYEQPLFIIEPS